MSTPLTEIQEFAIQQSFSAACGITALHLVLERFTDAESARIKEDIVKIWRDTWQETFQKEMLRYTKELGKVENSHQLGQPEDYQAAFNKVLGEVEKSGRISLRMGEGV